MTGSFQNHVTTVVLLYITTKPCANHCPIHYPVSGGFYER
jgi:hypothetical protein